MMEQYCGNCRYFRLDTDTFPCVECTRNTGSNATANYWAADLKDISDPDEKIGAILESQTYLLLEISRLRARVEELTNKE